MASPTRGTADVVQPVRSKARIPRRKLTIAALVVVIAIICLAGALYRRFSPFSEQSVLRELEEASDSQVTIRSFQETYFPSPGCVLKDIEFRRGTDHAEFITIRTLVIKGSYPGMLSRHIPRITASGAHVFIPKFGSNANFKTAPSKTVVDELLGRDAIVEFAPETSGKQPVRFEVHEAILKNVRWGGAIGYQLKFHNPNPSGEIAVDGNFGPWTPGNPQQTPLSGAYTFEHANLSEYGGIGGMLSSVGKFQGALQHVNVAGETDVPDFYVKSSGHRVHLVTHFDAYVDAMHGDTFLNHVEGHFGRTNVEAHGSIARAPGQKGKFTQIQLTSRQGRIEDILGLFVTAPRSPMSGPVSLQAGVHIPPGQQPFLRKVELDGTFGIDQGRFSHPETQHGVNELSAGARGDTKDKEDPETVMTDLDGHVRFRGGIASFTDLSFAIPGAHARMHGTYDLLTHRINLHGQMQVSTRISKTTTGVKALFLKVMDPIFKKKKKGEIVPVHILGTYEKPQFGLDITDNKGQKQTSK